MVHKKFKQSNFPFHLGTMGFPHKMIFKDLTSDADCNYFKWADGARSSKGVKRKSQ